MNDYFVRKVKTWWETENTLKKYKQDVNIK